MTAQEFAKMYLEGKSQKQIAKLAHCGIAKVRENLILLNIPIRQLSESVHLAKRPPQNIQESEELLEMLDGVLLGDGHLTNVGSYGSRLFLHQTQAHLGWVLQIKEQLEAANFQCSLGQYPAHIRHTTDGTPFQANPSCDVKTGTYEYLREQRNRWYPNGIKQVPVDIRISPRALAHWYFGNGHLAREGYSVEFCAESFSQQELQFLSQKLQDKYGWSPCITKTRNRLYLRREEDRLHFKSLISEFTPICFEYKLRMRERSPFRKMTAETKEEIKKLRMNGWKYKDIMKRYDMSLAGVSYVCTHMGVGAKIST